MRDPWIKIWLSDLSLNVCHYRGFFSCSFLNANLRITKSMGLRDLDCWHSQPLRGKYVCFQVVVRSWHSTRRYNLPPMHPIPPCCGQDSMPRPTCLDTSYLSRSLYYLSTVGTNLRSGTVHCPLLSNHCWICWKTEKSCSTGWPEGIFSGNSSCQPTSFNKAFGILHSQIFSITCELTCDIPPPLPDASGRWT